MIDRKKLEAAAYRLRTEGSANSEQLALICDAVETHLATLPKPTWRLLVHSATTSETHDYATREEAALAAGYWLRTRAYKVEIKEP